MSALVIIDKVLLVLAVLMLVRAVLPFGILIAFTMPLQTAARFVTPLGFDERMIAVIAALWLLGIRAAIPIGMMLRAWS